MHEFITGALLCFVLIREWQHNKNQHKLIDKLMSRNFYDYKISEAVTDVNKSNKEVVAQPRFQNIDDPLLEQELGSLTNLV